MFLFYFIYLFKKIFIYLWLCWVFVAMCRLSPVGGEQGATPCCGAWASHCRGLSLRSTGSRHAGLSSCGTWAQQLWLVGSRPQAQQLWHTGPVAPWHVGSSWARAPTRVPRIGRQILNHCTTREVLYVLET